MPILIIYGSVAITIALALYTITVFSGRRTLQLKKWHVGCYWLGLFFDALGTYFMFRHAERVEFNFHTFSGALGLVLMLMLTYLATMILLKKKGQINTGFHKSSLIIWAIWLLSYLSGVVAGFQKAAGG